MFNNTETTKLYWVPHTNEVCVLGQRINQVNEKTIKVRTVPFNIPNLDSYIEEQVGQESNLQKESSKVDLRALQGEQDLMTLDELNEYNLLHCLRVRYVNNQIYSQVGSQILVALNPYQYFPDLYSKQKKDFYRSKMKQDPSVEIEHYLSEIKKLEPHLYKVGQIALNYLFTDVISSQRQTGGKKNVKKICSVIISGESGAGKTESTKKLLEYIAMQREVNSSMISLSQSINKLQNRSGIRLNNTSIENKIFASNPILEAFGNAKTAKNDNSSRFGKFIAINYNLNKTINSANITNYLLEKSRVVSLSPTDRNYHIFYQLLSITDESLRNHLRLADKSQYNYLKGGDLSFEADDKSELQDTLQALGKIQFDQDDIKRLFEIVAGILHMGNIEFKGDEQQSQIIQSEALKICCQLLGLDPQQVNDAFCHINVYTNNGQLQFKRNNNLRLAQQLRDGLAKLIYSRMFDWIVNKININLRVSQKFTESDHMIGILDIFGFEIFIDEVSQIHANSFEQLCINFTNETLQLHFTKNMITAEQNEYMLEGIQWDVVNFKDNEPLLKIFREPQGFWRILSEQELAPSGQRSKDDVFQERIKNLKNPNFFFADTIMESIPDDKLINRSKHRLARDFQWIGVIHYAGPVVYNVNGFVEKNTDKVFTSINNLIVNSKNQLLKSFSKEEDKQKLPQQQNVITTFMNQLDTLMKILNESKPSYIRCIKTNQFKKPLSINSLDILRQMRQAGLQEAIRVRKSGYDVRLTFQQFLKQYLLLGGTNMGHLKQNAIGGMSEDQQRNICEQLLKVLGQKVELKDQLNSTNITLGQRKIFLKEVIKQHFDKNLQELQHKYLIKLQRAIKRFIKKRRLLKKLKLFYQRIQKVKKYLRNWILRRRTNKLIHFRFCVRRLGNLLKNFQIKTKFQKLKNWPKKIQTPLQITNPPPQLIQKNPYISPQHNQTDFQQPPINPINPSLESEVQKLKSQLRKLDKKVYSLKKELVSIKQNQNNKNPTDQVNVDVGKSQSDSNVDESMLESFVVIKSTEQQRNAEMDKSGEHKNHTIREENSDDEDIDQDQEVSLGEKLVLAELKNQQSKTLFETMFGIMKLKTLECNRLREKAKLGTMLNQEETLQLDELTTQFREILQRID